MQVTSTWLIAACALLGCNDAAGPTTDAATAADSAAATETAQADSVPGETFAETAAETSGDTIGACDPPITDPVTYLVTAELADQDDGLPELSVTRVAGQHRYCVVHGPPDVEIQFEADPASESNPDVAPNSVWEVRLAKRGYLTSTDHLGLVRAPGVPNVVERVPVILPRGVALGTIGPSTGTMGQPSAMPAVSPHTGVLFYASTDGWYAARATSSDQGTAIVTQALALPAQQTPAGMYQAFPRFTPDGVLAFIESPGAGFARTCAIVDVATGAVRAAQLDDGWCTLGATAARAPVALIDSVPNPASANKRLSALVRWSAAGLETLHTFDANGLGPTAINVLGTHVLHGSPISWKARSVYDLASGSETALPDSDDPVGALGYDGTWAFGALNVSTTTGLGDPFVQLGEVRTALATGAIGVWPSTSANVLAYVLSGDTTHVHRVAVPTLSDSAVEVPAFDPAHIDAIGDHLVLRTTGGSGGFAFVRLGTGEVTALAGTWSLDAPGQWAEIGVGGALDNWRTHPATRFYLRGPCNDAASACPVAVIDLEAGTDVRAHHHPFAGGTNAWAVCKGSNVCVTNVPIGEGADRVWSTGPASVEAPRWPYFGRGVPGAPLIEEVARRAEGIDLPCVPFVWNTTFACVR